MNKEELIVAYAEKTGCTKKDANLQISTLFDIITDTLVKKETVQLIGFGSFSTKERKGREARNPKTSETIQVPPYTAISFKAGKNLKEKVNE